MAPQVNCKTNAITFNNWWSNCGTLLKDTTCKNQLSSSTTRHLYLKSFLVRRELHNTRMKTMLVRRVEWRLARDRVDNYSSGKITSRNCLKVVCQSVELRQRYRMLELHCSQHSLWRRQVIDHLLSEWRLFCFPFSAFEWTYTSDQNTAAVRISCLHSDACEKLQVTKHNLILNN